MWAAFKLHWHKPQSLGEKVTTSLRVQQNNILDLSGCKKARKSFEPKNATY
jgi:hypothetical protein